ncbi:hypothetical protein V501_07262 [Pseudogymnoascus sp. VKM F-4519 (FW-2642)]|nr:hypothetical protein V501_07262 [Pseudogymnoascus sp. VKM F-4519 (FW-2642)]
MATDIPPFQLHLMLKLHNGKQLTLNEIRKAQEMGIEIPWPPTEGAPFENASGEEEQEGFPIGPVMHAVPPVRRNPEPFFPTRRDVVTNPDDGEGGVTNTAGDGIQGGVAPVQPLNKSQQLRGSPGQRPPPPPSNGQSGRHDTCYHPSHGSCYYPSHYLHLATNKYQYQIPDWAGQTQRDPYGNPRPRYNPRDDQDGRLDRRYPSTQYQRRTVDGGTANINGTTVTPDQIYSWPGSGVGLRIGTGGSDQSGLLVKLLDGYLQYCVEVKKETPFVVEFYASDSGVTIDYLSENIIDIGVTDSVLLDTLATNQGIIDRRETGWRDHWMLVGPQNNPAKLPENSDTSVYALFSALYTSLQADPGSSTVFLSRSDGSASNVKESSIWSAIGRTPSASAGASWYASSESSALETLAEAAMIGAYTLTDSGIWNAASEESRKELTIFAVGKDDDQDPLLKRAELVIGSKANNKQRANDFVDWVVRADGGQKEIGDFSPNGTVVFSPAPLPGSVPARPNGTTNGPNIKPDNLDKTIDDSKKKPTEANPVVLDKTTDGVDKKTNLSPEQKPPLKSNPLPRAILHLPWSVNEVYFFDGPKYLRLDAVDKTKTGTPIEVKGMWPALAGLPNGVDAVLTVDKEEKVAWVFSGDSCIVIDVETGKPFLGGKLNPWTIVFKGLKEKSGFESIDCVVPHYWKGGDPNCSTFFSGSKEFVHGIYSTNNGKPESEVSTNSPLLALMGFTKIDAFTFVPGTDFEEGYFFSGGKYAHVKLQPSTVLSFGDTHKNWLGLAKAGFFT